MELTREQLDALYDLTVVSDDGQTMGPVGHIYLDDQTQQATWITAKTGLFGLREVFIPFQGARVEPEAIKVRYTRDYIMDAPRFDSDGHISDAEQDELFRYFRVSRPRASDPTIDGPVPAEPADPPVGDEAGPLSDREPDLPADDGLDRNGGEPPVAVDPEPAPVEQAVTPDTEGPDLGAGAPEGQDPAHPHSQTPEAEPGTTDDRA